jgi:uncharacterized repeat protein (TIGR03803 family)
LTRPAKQQSAWQACALTLAAVLGLALGTSPSAQAQTFTVLYTFAGYPMDGDGPEAGLLMDGSGNLYGTTRFGGSVNRAYCHAEGGIGCGIVFKVDTNGMETVLHNFTGPDGANSSANLVMDANGDLYGTTEFGGRLQDCTDIGVAGCGVVFRLSGRKETVLHRFCSAPYCADGAEPWRGLVMDAAGALYGTAYYGGSVNGGVVFKLAGKRLTVLHSFTGSPDGAYPEAGLIMDAKWNLYGTTIYGGDFNCDGDGGCGVVFKLAGKKETVLYSFKGNFNGGSFDGAYPRAALFMDPQGNLYSTTVLGGEGNGGGTVFKLSRWDKESVLYTFNSLPDGVRPQSGVVRDAVGNLYGTTQAGG